MYAFSVSSFLLKNHSRALKYASPQTGALRITRFRGTCVQITPPCHENPLRSYRQIQIPMCFSEPPDDHEDDEEDEEQAEIVLTDPRTNRTLSAAIEHTITNENKTYVLCYPVDDPVMFAHSSDSGILVPVEDDALVQQMFPNAEAVLVEDHVILKNTAYFMTVDDQSEDIGDENDEHDNEDEDENQHEAEEQEQDVEVIGEFLHDGVPHFVVQPTNAVFLVAEVLESGYHVLEGEELQLVSPAIEEFIQDLDVAAT